MGSKSNWSSGDDEILIDFVRNHEVMYNTKSKEYRNTQLKQHFWRQIGEILNKTDSDCSKRWCYIRDYYIRRRGKPVSSGEVAKKRSDLLSFLDNLPASRPSITFTNVDDENPEDSDNNSEVTQDFLCDDVDRKGGILKNDKKRKINIQECLSPNDDGNELFFSSMAKIVKKLPRYEQARLRMQIGSLVGNAELRHISNDT